MTGVLIFIADDRQLRDLTFWALGSLAGATWPKIGAVGADHRRGAARRAVPGARAERAGARRGGGRHLGIPVQRLKNVAIVAVARGDRGVGRRVAAASASSASSCRICCASPIGPDHRYLLPASALLGASLLLLADTVSRTIVAPAELPIGIVTAAVGAPFFLWILLRRRGVLDL